MFRTPLTDDDRSVAGQLGISLADFAETKAAMLANRRLPPTRRLTSLAMPYAGTVAGAPAPGRVAALTDDDRSVAGQLGISLADFAETKAKMFGATRG